MTDAAFRLALHLNNRAAHHACLPIASPITALGYEAHAVSRRGRITLVHASPTLRSGLVW